MEVGAVKQAFNNEIILLKKKLNQAKIQIIHKLTRKAKTLTEKRVPEKLKLKFTKKAESAIKEVLIIKKIKARDVAKFIVTHKGQLNEYLNKPEVDHDKACARLLLHKALQDKYKFFRERFSTISIKDLLMSRQERRKLKKESREKQKNKKGKDGSESVQAEGDWSVEDINMDGSQINSSNIDEESSSDEQDEDEEIDNEDNMSVNYEPVNDIPKSNVLVRDNVSKGLINKTNVESSESNDEVESDNNSEKFDDLENQGHESAESDNSGEVESVGKFVKVAASLPDKELIASSNDSPLNVGKLKKDNNIILKEKKHKDNIKNKNLKNKILLKKFNKEKSETPQENKVVDPFFITETGENYMSVAEPRPPDEIKEVHKQGNRQYRRAVMFGHVPKAKPWSGDRRPDRNNLRFNKFDNSNKKTNLNSDFKSNGFNKYGSEKRFNKPVNIDRDHLKDRQNNNINKVENDSKPEKLHPSWEAKKRQSGILPFQGKKIVFDEG